MRMAAWHAQAAAEEDAAAAVLDPKAVVDSRVDGRRYAAKGPLRDALGDAAELLDELATLHAPDHHDRSQSSAGAYSE